MRKSVQSRWIEQAEARAVLERVAMHRNALEPYVGIVHAKYDQTGICWFRHLPRAVIRVMDLIRSLSVNNMIRIDTRPRTTLESPSALQDDDRILVAVLITDIVDSTRQVAEMGDQAWRVLLNRHDRATRDQIERFGGREVGSRGDGFVGIFNSPTRAVRCATKIADAIAPLGLLLRCGVHVGEVHLNSEKICGLTAHVAARIAAVAQPGEAVVSKLVRDLAAGSGIVFEDRGLHQLRGLSEEVHLFAVPEAAAPVPFRLHGFKTSSIERSPQQLLGPGTSI